MTSIIGADKQPVHNLIIFLRGQRVMIDADLAVLYGVTTRQLNQQVRRNRSRFPPDFMFRLTVAEKREVITKCDHLRRLKFSPTVPFAFTEHGALMLASVLNSSLAVQTSIDIVRVFIRLREAVSTLRDLAIKLDSLERRSDRQFKVVFDSIRELMKPPVRRTRRIGFEARPVKR
jgi:hypothetical protein